LTIRIVALDGCGLRALLDQCRGAGIVRPNAGGLTLRLRRATTEPREPVPGCGCAEPIGVAWLRLISPLTATAIVTLTEPGGAIALDVYSPLCAAAEEQACADIAAGGSGRLVVPMQEEEEVAIAVAVCDPPPEFVRMHVDLCGDGNISHLEECDDGDILDGDGCTADCRFADLGGIDQWWTGPRGSCGTSSSSNESVPIPTEADPPVAQIVTPAADTLAGVDVSITSHLRFGDSLSLIVRSGSVDGPVPARVDQVEPAVRSRGWNHFRLATPIALEPGQPYALQLAASAPGAGWASNTGYDGQGCTAARYPGAPAICDGEEQPLSFLFRTYAAAP
jgi:cysteine-rich repeat protein